MTTKEQIPSQFLDEIEKEKVMQFMGDAIMREAVRKYLFTAIYVNGCIEKGKTYDPRRNWALFLVNKEEPGKQSDESIGQELRAYSWATNMVESAFQKMDELKPDAPAPEPKQNPAL